MSPLFTRAIRDWESWQAAARARDVWQPLIRSIFRRENLPCRQIEYLTPATNAVYKVDGYVIKIFAPAEAKVGTADFQSEVQAMERVAGLGIPIPRLRACGMAEDAYTFAYLIMDYVAGTEFAKRAKQFTEEEKTAFGQKLRIITDAMNTPFRPVYDVDVVHDPGRHESWAPYPARFQAERLDYLRRYAWGERVFVHGDLNGHNILLGEQDAEIYLIDFADAVAAPVIYEQAYAASELFTFDKAFLRGYFGDYDPINVTELCFHGLLIHDFGGDVIERHVARPEEITDLAAMRQKLYARIR